MKDIIFSLKLVFSPLKILLCVAITFLIPLVVKSMSIYDFYRIFAMYISFIGIIVFTEIPLIDIKSGMDEIIYLTQEMTWKKYFFRILSGALVISLLVLLSAYIFVLRISYKDILIVYDLNTQIQLLISVMPYILLLGIIAMTISNIFRSAMFGYVVASVYWLVNALYREEYIVASINETSTIVYIISVSFVLILINLHLDSLKPTKRGFLVKILRIKELKQKLVLLCKDYNLINEEDY
ncbi:MAG: hypothetical protein WBA54_13655 [Acidaminobacteraceae bacterium]